MLRHEEATPEQQAVIDRHAQLLRAFVSVHKDGAATKEAKSQAATELNDVMDELVDQSVITSREAGLMYVGSYRGVFDSVDDGYGPDRDY